VATADELVEGFWLESTPRMRRLFLDEAAGRSAGVVTYEFDTVDVRLNFETGVAMIIANIFQTMRRPKDAGNDPWDAATLEWSIPSPPPVYNFAVSPIVRSRDAFWAWKRRPQAIEAGENEARVQLAGHTIGHVEVEESYPSEEYMAQERNAVYADPATFHIPNPSFFPIIAAFGLVMMAVGLIFGYVLTVAGFLYLVIAIGGWALEPTS